MTDFWESAMYDGALSLVTWRCLMLVAPSSAISAGNSVKRGVEPVCPTLVASQEGGTIACPDVVLISKLNRNNNVFIVF